MQTLHETASNSRVSGLEMPQGSPFKVEWDSGLNGGGLGWAGLDPSILNLRLGLEGVLTLRIFLLHFFLRTMYCSLAHLVEQDFSVTEW